ncbi:MAG: hypothetical protein DMF69_18145 [Acidobacteria bacterium]|nr:MAG: hypothetical protein DMF69_18145 [Acidobacteriota bacterium]
MPNWELNQRTANEWRELGFFYDYDKGESCWRLVGSREGLMKFVELLESYVMKPQNGQLSEHQHYGPYFYLKLMTWSQAQITDNAICGTLSDFRRLANLVRSKLESLGEGSIVTIGDEYAPSTSVLRFEVKEAGFDPARADPLLSPAS